MIIGNKIAIIGVELIVKAPVVTTTTAAEPLAGFKEEIAHLVASISLNSVAQTLESSNFKLVIDGPLTFDTVFMTVVRRSSVKIERELTTKDQNGKITSFAAKIDPNSSVYVSVFGQIFRAEYLKRLYALIESSSQKTTLLSEVNARLDELYATAKILGPTPDELVGVVDGGIYLYRDTITQNSDFFVSLSYSALPPQLIADFEFMRASSLNGLYSLEGYTPGMNSGIEEALSARGALSKLNDSAKWLHVAETLETVVVAPQAIVDLLAFDSPRILAFISLARKVSLKNQEISLSALDSNTLKLCATLRKISNKSDLVVLSTNELIQDIVELAPYLSSDLVAQEQFVKLYCKFSGVTSSTVVYSGANEAQKRLIRLATSQWTSDYSAITGIVSSASGSAVIFTASGVEIARQTFVGPFSSQIPSIEIGRSAELNSLIKTLAAVAALIDTASMGKIFSISPSTKQMSFSYTIDQLKEAIAELLVDTTRSMYKRS